MRKVIQELITLAEDKGTHVITDDIIEGYIFANMELIIDEIKKELGV